MITSIAHVACQVRDVDAALHFYRDVLGFKESHRVHTPTGRLIICLWAGGETFLELLPGGTDGPEQAKDRAGYLHMGLWVDDIHATVRALQAQGFAQGCEPTLGGDGVWGVMISDLDGNQIELWQMTPESLPAQTIARVNPNVL